MFRTLLLRCSVICTQYWFCVFGRDVKCHPMGFFKNSAKHEMFAGLREKTMVVVLYETQVSSPKKIVKS